MQAGSLLRRRTSRPQDGIRFPAAISETRRVGKSTQPDEEENHRMKPAYSPSNLQVEGPSVSVLRELKNNYSKGPQLLQHIRDVLRIVREGSGTPCSDASRLLGYGLSDIHATLFEVDEELMDSNLALEEPRLATDCRRWLQQLQSFVMSLQREVQRFQQVEADTDSQLAAAWSVFVDTAAAKLQILIAAIEDSEAMDQAMSAPVCSPALPTSGIPSKTLSRLVCQRSKLSYKQHWAGKVSV